MIWNAVSACLLFIFLMRSCGGGWGERYAMQRPGPVRIVIIEGVGMPRGIRKVIYEASKPSMLRRESIQLFICNGKVGAWNLSYKKWTATFPGLEIIFLLRHWGCGKEPNGNTEDFLNIGHILKYISSASHTATRKPLVLNWTPGVDIYPFSQIQVTSFFYITEMSLIRALAMTCNGVCMHPFNKS